MQRAVLFSFCVLLGVSQSLAAQATAEEAQRLVDVFHRYVGMPRAGQADHLRVEPQGEAYRVTIDFDVLASPLAPLGFFLDAAETSFVAQPLPDGTWKVSDWQMPSPVTMRIMDQTTSIRLEDLKFEGIYDPVLAAFTSFDQTIGVMSTEAEGPQGRGTTRYGEQIIHGTATAAGEDAVNIVARQAVDSFSAEQTVVIPATDPGTAAPPPITFSYAVDSAAVDVSFSALKIRKLLDLWAFAVEQIQTGRPITEEDELKVLLTDALPVFASLEESGLITGIEVETPLGKFGLKQLSGSLSMTGLVTESEFKFKVKMGNPIYPAELVPTWANDLVPSEFDFGLGVSNLNFDAWSRFLIDKLDLMNVKDGALHQRIGEEAVKLLVGEDGGTVTLSPGRIGGQVLGVEFAGEFSMKIPAPSGSITLAVSGMKEAMAILMEAANDPRAQQALGALTIAQMYGKANNGGAVIYEIEFKDDGSVSVNGQQLKPPNGTPL